MSVQQYDLAKHVRVGAQRQSTTSMRADTQPEACPDEAEWFDVVVLRCGSCGVFSWGVDVHQHLKYTDLENDITLGLPGVDAAYPAERFSVSMMKSSPELIYQQQVIRWQSTERGRRIVAYRVLIQARVSWTLSTSAQVAAFTARPMSLFVSGPKARAQVVNVSTREKSLLLVQLQGSGPHFPLLLFPRPEIGDTLREASHHLFCPPEQHHVQ